MEKQRNYSSLSPQIKSRRDCDCLPDNQTVIEDTDTEKVSASNEHDRDFILRTMQS